MLRFMSSMFFMGMLMCLAYTFDQQQADIYLLDGSLPFQYLAFYFAVFMFTGFVVLRIANGILARRTLCKALQEFKDEMLDYAPEDVSEREVEAKNLLDKRLTFFRFRHASKMEFLACRISTDKCLLALDKHRNGS